MLTLKEFKEKDLCFRYDDQLYNYDTLEDFYQDIYENLSGENNPMEFDIAYQNEIEKVKHIAVFSKEYFKMPPDRIKSSIKDYINDYWGNGIIERDVDITVVAEEYLNKFLKEVEEDNKIWRNNEKVGYIDLSKEVEKFIKEDYGDNE
jgi:hypothetical protein